MPALYYLYQTGADVLWEVSVVPLIDTLAFDSIPELSRRVSYFYSDATRSLSIP
jgi:hypothetical protein